MKCIFDDNKTNHEKEVIFGHFQNKFKKEIEIKFLCNYFNDLFIVKDLVEIKIKLFQFKDGALLFFHDFPVQVFKKIFKLKDNNFLLHFKNRLEIWEIK